MAAAGTLVTAYKENLMAVVTAMSPPTERIATAGRAVQALTSD